MHATVVRRSAQLATVLCLLHTVLCHAARPDQDVAALGHALAKHGSWQVIAGIYFVLFSLGVWMASKILGIEGGFWRSAVAALITIVVGLGACMLLDPNAPFLMSFVVGTIVGTAAIKLGLKASVPKALLCSVSSALLTAILGAVVITAVGVNV